MAGKKSHLGLRGFDPRSPFYFFSGPEGSVYNFSCFCNEQTLKFRFPG